VRERSLSRKSRQNLLRKIPLVPRSRSYESQASSQAHWNFFVSLRLIRAARDLLSLNRISRAVRSQFECLECPLVIRDPETSSLPQSLRQSEHQSRIGTGDSSSLSNDAPTGTPCRQRSPGVRLLSPSPSSRELVSLSIALHRPCPRILPRKSRLDYPAGRQPVR